MWRIPQFSGTSSFASVRQNEIIRAWSSCGESPRPTPLSCCGILKLFQENGIVVFLCALLVAHVRLCCDCAGFVHRCTSPLSSDRPRRGPCHVRCCVQYSCHSSCVPFVDVRLCCVPGPRRLCCLSGSGVRGGRQAVLVSTLVSSVCPSHSLALLPRARHG